MKLWLDDIRPPWKYGHIGWEWAKTADEAIALLKSGKVTEASLDHDLSYEATLGQQPAKEKTGYDVVLWMEKHGVFPHHVTIHSMNAVGASRMSRALERHCRVKVRPAILP